MLRVEGGRQLRAALRQAAGDLGELKDVNREAAGVAARAGQAIAPRRTGMLAGSVRAGATQSAAIVRAGNARVPYAGVIEYGWAARHIAPHPFLREGATRTEPHWIELYRARIEQLIHRIERKAHP